MNSNSSQREPLAPEQLDRLPEYRQKWLQFAWSTERVDRTIAIEAIQAMYRWVKLERPDIEFCANPLQLRERVEAYLEGDPERWRSPGYYSRGRHGSSWAKIHRLNELLWPNLHGPTGNESLKYLGQHLHDPLEKHLERQWDTVRHEVGLHWRRGLEAQLWQVMQYPTWLISQGAVIDFCITELGYIWKEDDWLIELGLPLGTQEQWQLVQTLTSHVGWFVPLIGMCWVCDRPTKVVLDDSGQLHGQMEPAIEYAGGFHVHAYHGLWLTDLFRQAPSQWNPMWLLSFRDAEHQRMMIQEIGYDRICQHSKIRTVDTWQNYTLYWFPLSGGRKLYLLKTACETTGTSQYAKVPALTSARAAVNWVNEQASET